MKDVFGGCFLVVLGLVSSGVCAKDRVYIVGSITVQRFAATAAERFSEEKTNKRKNSPCRRDGHRGGCYK